MAKLIMLEAINEKHRAAVTEAYGVLADRDEVLEIVSHLETVESVEAGRQYLIDLTKEREIDIRPVGVYLDIPNAKRLGSKQIIEDILTFTVQARFNSAAIRGANL